MQAKEIMRLTMEILARVGVNEPTPNEVNLVKAVLTHVHVSHELHFNPTLSFRERQCLLYLAKGKSFREIATLMDIKRTTVATFVKRIKLKLHCQTLPQLIFTGIAHRDIW